MKLFNKRGRLRNPISDKKSDGSLDQETLSGHDYFFEFI